MAFLLVMIIRNDLPRMAAHIGGRGLPIRKKYMLGTSKGMAIMQKKECTKVGMTIDTLLY